MPLRPETVERVWAMWHDPELPLRAVSVMTIAGESFIAAPAAYRERLADVAPTVDAVIAALGPDALERGPEARLAYADADTLQLVPSNAVRIADDDPRHAPLEATSDPAEWQEASAADPADARYALFDDEAIIALATMGAWGGGVGSIGVFTAEPWRGRGLSGQVASPAVAAVIARGLVPQWQSRIGLGASARVSEKLGFVPLGYRRIVRIRPPDGGGVEKIGAHERNRRQAHRPPRPV